MATSCNAAKWKCWKKIMEFGLIPGAKGNKLPDNAKFARIIAGFGGYDEFWRRVNEMTARRENGSRVRSSDPSDVQPPEGAKGIPSVKPAAKKVAPGWVELRAYLQTEEGNALWRSLRFRVLAKHKRCCLCGRSRVDGVILHVDHIKPKSTHPHLAFCEDNLQVLCEDCNMGKGNTDEQDFR